MPPQETGIWSALGPTCILHRLHNKQELVEVQSLSPNVPDPNTYTPMYVLPLTRSVQSDLANLSRHAAASYGHLNVLEYLISQGGDVNVTDNDGDTPLYVVENIESARFLVEHGATVDHRNSEGISVSMLAPSASSNGHCLWLFQPAQYLEEDFPEIARYLQAIPSFRNDRSTIHVVANANATVAACAKCCFRNLDHITSTRGA
ncbi:Ankyrin repeat-containing protein P1E11.10 [Grifola frondosa]|uniref:Ankyrin repeat-containing protein P1E11.10 n=1 Tax=Grifola frondosa TaxID=5627 RepID=A0A1C7M757_GRIFR|nr:Ankyrin repeat-containing protein P1E11.10 [Grifola frondosa]